MSEFDDLVAECGITIVESQKGDAGDDNPNQNTTVSVLDQGGDASMSDPVQMLERIFSYRYTTEDSEYMETVTKEEYKKSPPCVTDFREKSHGNFHNQGGRGAHNYRGGKGDYGDNRRWSNYNRRDNEDYDKRGRYGNRDGGGYRYEGGDGRRHHYHQNTYRERE